MLISPGMRPAERKVRVMSLVVPSQRAKAGRARARSIRGKEASFICRASRKRGWLGRANLSRRVLTLVGAGLAVPAVRGKLRCVNAKARYRRTFALCGAYSSAAALRDYDGRGALC